MLKKSLLLTLSLLLVFSLAAFAGEGSDTVGGGKLLPQLRYGYSATEWNTDSAAAFGYHDWDIRAHTYNAQLNWGIVNNVDLFAVIGGRAIDLESDGPRGSIESDGWVPAFMVGLGTRVTFFRADNGFYVGGGALFTYTRSCDFQLDEMGVTAPLGNYDATLDVYMLVPELHAGWHIGDTGLTPYIGVDYVVSRAVAEIDGVGDVELHVEDPVFMFVGLDHYINDRLYLNFEGRTNFNEGWGFEGGIGYLFDICPKPAPPVVEPAPPIEPKLEPMSKN